LSGLTYYCFHCYGENAEPRGTCRHCGRRIEAPEGTSYTELLVWALDHPIGDVALRAAETLGLRRERRARDRLRELAVSRRDPYLAAEALRSLIRIEGEEELRPLLERLARSGSAPVRKVASEAIASRPSHPEV
jgi:HEAT repeat protein